MRDITKKIITTVAIADKQWKIMRILIFVAKCGKNKLPLRERSRLILKPPLIARYIAKRTKSTTTFKDRFHFVRNSGTIVHNSPTLGFHWLESQWKHHKRQIFVYFRLNLKLGTFAFENFGAVWSLEGTCEKILNAISSFLNKFKINVSSQKTENQS